MMKLIVGLLVAFWGSSAYAQEVFKPTTRDDKIRYSLIKQSISKFKGKCPCPYSTYKNGVKCGSRSLWSKIDGRNPICFHVDIPQSVVNRIKRKQS